MNYFLFFVFSWIFTDRLVVRTSANHATRTFDRPSTPHPDFPYPDDFANGVVKDLQRIAEETAQDLIVTAATSTQLLVQALSDIRYHKKSSNAYPHSFQTK